MTNENTETRALRIIERLKMFNRKERDHLMKFALCDKPEEPKISPALWAIVGNSPTMPEPDEMFIGMDYHLNWLYAALATNETEKALSDETFENEWKRKRDGEGKGECKFELPLEKDEKSGPIRGNQEDVDLLVAWWDNNSERLKLVLVEAKLDSGWASKQFMSKKERLGLIYQDAKNRRLDFVNWRFLLLSPGVRPKGEAFTDSQSFSEDPYKWFQEPGKDSLWHETLPVKNDLWRVKRVDDSGKEWTAIVSKKATKENGKSNGND